MILADEPDHSYFVPEARVVRELRVRLVRSPPFEVEFAWRDHQHIRHLDR